VSAPLPEVGAALRTLGTALLATGTAGYRVDRAMQRAGTALGCHQVESLSTLKTLVLTVERDGDAWTTTGSVPALHVDAERLDRLEQLVRHLPAQTTPSALVASVQQVRDAPSLYPPWVVAVAVGIACGGFAGLNGGGAVEIAAAVTGATVGQAVRAWLLSRRVNAFLVVAATAALAAGVYLATVALLGAVGLAGTVNEAGFVSAALFLVPGFPLVTGTLDILRTRVEAGVARLTYATTVLVMATIGLLVVPALAAPQRSGLTTTVVGQSGWVAAVLLSLVGGAGFAVLFHLQVRLALVAGAAAALGNVVRLVLLETGNQNLLATFVGALVVGLVGAAAAPRLHVSRIVLTIPGVIPMVPGVAAYTGLVELSAGNLLPALASGLDAALLIGALALGLAAARLLTDRDWLFTG
jgi:uncharacterized membrane protein YjjP (DUF1212 family)